MTEFPYGQYGHHERLEFRDTPDDLLDALRFTSQEDRGRLLDPALWRSLETIIHNQRVLYRILERLLGRTSQIVTDLSPIANAVANETSVEQSVITLVQQLADEVRANAGDPAAVQQLADQITANATALSQAITANTPAAASPTPATNPTTSTGTDSGAPTASGSVDLSGTGDNSTPLVDNSAGAPSTAADVGVSTGSDVGQVSPSTPSLPVYLHVGDGPVDFAEWVLVTGTQTLGGQSLYNYVGDTPGGSPTGASADWQVYTGPVQGGTSGQVDTSGSSVPHTPIDTTGV